MSRKDDRKHALRLIFQIEFFNDFEPKIAIEQYFDSIGIELDEEAEEANNGKKSHVKKIDRPFVEKEFLGTISSKEEIDKLINKSAQGWSVSRLSKIDLAIMRLSTYEMRHTNIPQSVSINEAVELAKIFSSDDSPSFINGVLGNVANAINKMDIEKQI